MWKKFHSSTLIVVIVVAFRLSLFSRRNGEQSEQFYFNYTLVVASFHNLIKSSKLILNNYMKLKYILSDFLPPSPLRERENRAISIFSLSHSATKLT